MAGEALTYFVTILIPTVDEFLNAQNDERRALLAFLVVNGMSDHYFKEAISIGAVTVDWKTFVTEIRREHEHLRVAKQIADATKHAKVIVGNASCAKRVKVVDPRSAYGSPFMGYKVAGAYSSFTVHVEVGPGNFIEAIALLKQSTLFWATQVQYDETFMRNLDRFRSAS